MKESKGVRGNYWKRGGVPVRKVKAGKSPVVANRRDEMWGGGWWGHMRSWSFTQDGSPWKSA